MLFVNPFSPSPPIKQEFAEIWRIALPLLVAQSAQMGTGVVDTLMAARYNPLDLAAIAVGYNIWLPAYLTILGVLYAGAAIVAQDFGAGRTREIQRLLPQSLWVAILLGLLIAPLVWQNQWVVELLELHDDTAQKAVDYTQMVALGLPATGLFLALRFHTQGLGITRPFAVASVVGFLANIPLNYAFIYGAWGAPELGAKGCGIATAISMWLGLLLILGQVARESAVRDYLPAFRWHPPEWSIIKEIMRLGIPLGLTFFLEVGVFSLIALLVARLGEVAIAAHQIAFNIWDMFYIPMLAIGSAMSTRIGHAIGAEFSEGVLRAFWVAAALAAVISLATTLLLLLAPDWIISLYTDDADIRTLAEQLIGLAALFIVFDAGQIVGSFTLRAFKETRLPFVITVVAYWLLALPLGYWLGLVVADNASDGAAGFWWATIAGIATCTLLIGLRVVALLRMPLAKAPQ